MKNMEVFYRPLCQPLVYKVLDKLTFSYGYYTKASWEQNSSGKRLDNNTLKCFKLIQNEIFNSCVTIYVNNTKYSYTITIMLTERAINKVAFFASL